MLGPAFGGPGRAFRAAMVMTMRLGPAFGGQGLHYRMHVKRLVPNSTVSPGRRVVG